MSKWPVCWDARGDATTTSASAAFEAPRIGKPRFVIANTIKGRGVSFIENRVEWHHKVPSAEQTKQALEELAAR